MKASIAREFAIRKHQIEARLRQRKMATQEKPAFTASNVEYEVSGRGNGQAAGGLGVMKLITRRLGLVDAIDDRIPVIKLHRPYHESAHVLTIPFRGCKNVWANSIGHASPRVVRGVSDGISSDKRAHAHGFREKHSSALPQNSTIGRL